MPDLDIDTLLHGLGGGAALAAAIALARLVVEFLIRRSDRGFDEDDRRRGHLRDAESRVERILQERLAQADRHLDRAAADVELERAQRASVERDYALLEQAHQLLQQHYAMLLREHRRAEGRPDHQDRTAARGASR